MDKLQQIRATLPAYPIEVEFPEIRVWEHGNTGIPYLHCIDSGVAGPHVLIMALTHGNEVSGAIAVDRLLRSCLRPVQGKVSLGFANVEAYFRFDPAQADAVRYVDEDMNRVWSPERLQSAQQSLELQRARALQPYIDTVDFLLDIHSMHEAAPPVMMTGPLRKGVEFAAQVAVPEYVVIDAGHANGRRMRDYAGFGDADSPRNALLIETGQHFSASSAQVALDAAARFLLATGVVQDDQLAQFLTQTPVQRQQILQVTDAVVATSMDFSFAADYRGMEVIADKGTVIARDGGREIVTPYDQCVLVQPSLRHLGIGVTVLRLARFTDFAE